MRWLQILRLVVAAGLLLGLGHAVMHVVAKPQEPKAADREAQGVAAGDESTAVGPDDKKPESLKRLHSFIYRRGPVQHAILGVAAFALVLLYWRQRCYLENAAQLIAAYLLSD